jgi:hypothetical protein
MSTRSSTDKKTPHLEKGIPVPTDYLLNRYLFEYHAKAMKNRTKTTAAGTVIVRIPVKAAIGSPGEILGIACIMSNKKPINAVKSARICTSLE